MVSCLDFETFVRVIWILTLLISVGIYIKYGKKGTVQLIATAILLLLFSALMLSQGLMGCANV